MWSPPVDVRSGCRSVSVSVARLTNVGPVALRPRLATGLPLSIASWFPPASWRLQTSGPALAVRASTLRLELVLGWSPWAVRPLMRGQWSLRRTQADSPAVYRRPPDRVAPYCNASRMRRVSRRTQDLGNSHHNGRGVLNVTATLDPPAATVPGKSIGCPNGNWTGVDPVSGGITGATLTITQGGKQIYSQFFDNPNN